MGGKRYVYIVGAGLTKALQGRMPVPLMMDFIPVMTAYIRNPVVSAALAVLVQHESIWGWPLPAELREFPQLRSSRPAMQPLELERVAQVIRRLPARNIEDILVAFDRPPDRRLGKRFAFAINQVFSLADGSLERCCLETFLRRQFGTGGEHTFISFNYDLALDKCVQTVSAEFPSTRWDPSDGYGFEPDALTDQSLERKGSSGVKLLKPHGSLSWRVGFHDNYEFVDRTPSVIRDEADGVVAYDPDFDRFVADENGPFQGGVFIIPPGNGERRRMAFIRGIVSQEQDSLRKADEISVIGWSLPPTDADQSCLIRAAVADRPTPPDRVTVINRGAPVEYYERIRDLFGVEKDRVLVFNDGFRDYVQETSKVA